MLPTAPKPAQAPSTSGTTPFRPGMPFPQQRPTTIKAQAPRPNPVAVKPPAFAQATPQGIQQAAQAAMKVGGDTAARAVNTRLGVLYGLGEGEYGPDLGELFGKAGGDGGWEEGNGGGGGMNPFGGPGRPAPGPGFRWGALTKQAANGAVAAASVPPQPQPPGMMAPPGGGMMPPGVAPAPPMGGMMPPGVGPTPPQGAPPMGGMPAPGGPMGGPPMQQPPVPGRPPMPSTLSPTDAPVPNLAADLVGQGKEQRTTVGESAKMQDMGLRAKPGLSRGSSGGAPGGPLAKTAAPNVVIKTALYGAMGRRLGRVGSGYQTVQLGPDKFVPKPRPPLPTPPPLYAQIRSALQQRQQPYGPYGMRPFGGWSKLSGDYTFAAEDCPKCGVAMEGDSYTGACNSCQHRWGTKTAAWLEKLAAGAWYDDPRRLALASEAAGKHAADAPTWLKRLGLSTGTSNDPTVGASSPGPAKEQAHDGREKAADESGALTTLGGAGLAASAAGGLGAATVGGLASAAKSQLSGFAKKLKAADPYDPKAAGRVRAFQDAVAGSRTPAERFVNYTDHGSRLMGTPAFRGGATGRDVMEKIYNNPLLSSVAKKFVAKPESFAWTPGKAQHYGEFAKGPVRAVEQLGREIYGEKGDKGLAGQAREAVKGRTAAQAGRVQARLAPRLAEAERAAVRSRGSADVSQLPHDRAAAGPQARLNTLRRRLGIAGDVEGVAGRRFERGLKATGVADPTTQALRLNLNELHGGRGINLDTLAHGEQRNLIERFAKTPAGAGMADTFARKWDGHINQYRGLGDAMMTPKRVIDAAGGTLEGAAGRAGRVARGAGKAGLASLALAAPSGLAYLTGKQHDAQAAEAAQQRLADRFAQAVRGKQAADLEKVANPAAAPTVVRTLQGAGKAVKDYLGGRAMADVNKMTKNKLPKFDALGEEQAELGKQQFLRKLTGGYSDRPGVHVKDRLAGGAVGGVGGVTADDAAGGHTGATGVARRVGAGLAGAAAGGKGLNATMNVGRRYVSNTSPLFGYEVGEVPRLTLKNLWKHGVKDQRAANPANAAAAVGPEHAPGGEARYELLRRYLGVHTPGAKDLFVKGKDGALTFNPAVVKPGHPLHEHLTEEAGRHLKTPTADAPYSNWSSRNPLRSVFGSHDTRLDGVERSATGLTAKRTVGDAWNFAIDPHEKPIIRQYLGGLARTSPARMKEYLKQPDRLGHNNVDDEKTVGGVLGAAGLRTVMEKVMRKETPVVRARLTSHYPDSPWREPTHKLGADMEKVANPALVQGAQQAGQRFLPRIWQWLGMGGKAAPQAAKPSLMGGGNWSGVPGAPAAGAPAAAGASRFSPQAVGAAPGQAAHAAARARTVTPTSGFWGHAGAQALPSLGGAIGGGFAADSHGQDWRLGAATGALAFNPRFGQAMRARGAGAMTPVHAVRGGIGGNFAGSTIDHAAGAFGADTGGRFARAGTWLGGGLGLGRGMGGLMARGGGNSTTAMLGRDAAVTGARGMGAVGNFTRGTFDPIVGGLRRGANWVTGGRYARLHSPAQAAAAAGRAAPVPGVARRLGQVVGGAGLVGTAGGAALGAIDRKVDDKANEVFGAGLGALDEYADGKFNQYAAQAPRAIVGGMVNSLTNPALQALGMDPNSVHPMQRALMLGGAGLGAAGLATGSPVVGGLGALGMGAGYMANRHNPLTGQPPQQSGSPFGERNELAHQQQLQQPQSPGWL